ncbi:hypothetical protein HK096_001583, partial [Nowakowskiella sp. JEL0078]
IEKIPSSVQIIETNNGTKYIIDFRRIQNANKLNWILVITTPYSDVWGEIQRTQNNTIVIIAVVTALSIALSVAFSYTLTNPVKVLGKVMGEVSNFNFETLAKGYLDRRSSLAEIAKMQQAFHTMVVKFAAAIESNKKLTGGSIAPVSQNDSTKAPKSQV